MRGLRLAAGHKWYELDYIIILVWIQAEKQYDAICQESREVA